jgi:3-isopropylmalate dehydrogenase
VFTLGTFSIAVLAGDGIGPEVTAQAQLVLQTIGQHYNHTFHFTPALVGLSALATEGVAISDETMALCHQSDAILFGAVGGASHDAPPEKKPEQALFRLRKELQLFANLRPIRPFQALLNASTIKADVLQGTDLLVVRELTGGIYFGKPSEIRRTAQGIEAIDTLIYTEAEIERILRTAFDLARGRQKRVASVDKANVLSSSLLWREIATRIAREYPDILLEHLLVDACAMHLIRRPASFDVIVTENMFGDILTDEASMLTGSMGMLPSASLGTRKTAHGVFGLYEPIHGSAPDIVGQEKANPIAAILSAALLLRYSLGLHQEAEAIEQAVEQTIQSGYRTADIFENGKTLLSTKAMGRQITEAIATISV